MEELEPWELDEIKGPDCDGARWMTNRGRKERLERIYSIEHDESNTEGPENTTL